MKWKLSRRDKTLTVDTGDRIHTFWFGKDPGSVWLEGDIRCRELTACLDCEHYGGKGTICLASNNCPVSFDSITGTRRPQFSVRSCQEINHCGYCEWFQKKEVGDNG